MAETIRAFIALPLPAPLLEKIEVLQRQLKKEPALTDARWANPATLHLTLAFLGEITEELLDQCAAVMLSVSDSQGAFSLRVRTLGVFPSSRHARVLWIGVDGGAPLLDLQQRLAAGLAGLGLTPEARSFKPHLTLARFRFPAHLDPLPAAATDLGTFPAQRVILFSSRLAPHGAIHTVRAEAALAAPAATIDHHRGFEHE